MVNHIRYRAYFAMAFLLAGEGLVKADVYVCGISYDDAVANCVVNTACPNGEGCVSKQTCFAIPEDDCVGMTTSPAPTVTPDLYVCGISYEDALSKCNSEDEACQDVTDTTAYCALTGDDVARSCFIIPHEDCLTVAPSSSPISGAATTTTSSPTVGMISASGSPSVSLGSTASVPTISPTPEFLSVCGVDYSNASDNFCTLTYCPTGDVRYCACSLSVAVNYVLSSTPYLTSNYPFVIIVILTFLLNRGAMRA